MTDPACLLDSSVDEFERALLRAAERDVGSPSAKARCIAAVSPAAVLLTTTQSSSAAVLFSVVKALGLGLVLGTVASGAAIFATTSRNTSAAAVANGKGALAGRRSATAASSASIVRSSDSMPAAAPTSRGLDSQSELGASTASPLTRASARSFVVPKAQSPLIAASAAALSHELASSPPSAPQARPAPLDRSLELEVQTLDRARLELTAGDARRALGTLDHYVRDFPNGVLLPESVFLRVRALIAAGQRAEAGALGRRFLATRSAGADARKLSQLLEQEQLR